MIMAETKTEMVHAESNTQTLIRTLGVGLTDAASITPVLAASGITMETFFL
jgi:hypothetical protein